jgi:putative transposase
MSNYRRANIKGGTYFFTVVAFRRQRFLCDDNVRIALRNAVRDTQAAHPFTIDGWVLLPDHLHCIWTLPPDDADFGKRWAMIKRYVTKQCGPSLHRGNLMTDSKRRRNECTLWQRRFWEHQIRDETDFQRHMDYIHYNPVKHGYVKRAVDWPHSTFHRYVASGVYHADWGGTQETTVDADFGE